MSVEALLANRKATRVFFELLPGRSRLERLARACRLPKPELSRLLQRMQRAGLVEASRAGFAVDWNRFLPIFLHHAMSIYAAAMPWKFIPHYLEKPDADLVEVSCARAERELARVKVRLASNDLFGDLLRQYLSNLAAEVSAPEDYLQDLRLSDAIAEFEYALLKLVPSIKKPRLADDQTRELFRLLREWHAQIQAYDTPLGAALRQAFHRQGLL